MSRVIGIISLVILLLLAGMTFGFSSQDGEASSGVSREVTEMVCEVTVKDFDEMPQASQNTIIDGLEHFIRKTAHFSIYLLMGLCAYCCAINLLSKLRHRAAAALIYCLLFAAADELHQCFVPGRTFKVTDILIDVCGALVGMIILRIIILIIDYIKEFIEERRIPKGR